MDAGNRAPTRSPGGSVRNARQRATEQTGDIPRVRIDPNPTEIEPPGRAFNPGNRHPPVPPIPPLAAERRPPVGNAFAPRSPARRPNSPSGDGAVGRGPPPQRPPRPNFVPSMVDPSQRAQFTEQQHPEYWEGSPVSPPGRDRFSERYSSGSSRPTTGSTGSSTGTIPDFPSPTNPPATAYPPASSYIPRRILSLGPPPSARKGGNTYYSQNSFVTPILEEQSESHNSYASSSAMPASWGDGAPDIGEGIEEEDEDGVGSSRSQSRAGDHDESTNLVRQVSIGKAGKPALKQIKSGERLRDVDSAKTQHSTGRSRAGLGAIAATAVGGAAAGEAPRRDNSSLYSSMEDSAAVPAPLRPSAAPSRGASATTSGSVTPNSPLDPRVKEVLGGLEKGGAIGTSGVSSFNATPPSMSEKGQKKPPRLNLEVVREQEARGSSSSLPELIRRATKLASNLDRGRTASRLGFLGMLEEKEKARGNQSPKGSRRNSISDMLAAFPSPSIHTPTGDRPGSHFHSPKQRSGLSRTHTAAPGSPMSYDEKHRSRKCCGMPVWAFALLTIILILLIAAAVIIPVTLIVLPKNKSNAATLSSCASTAPCSNGGTNVLTSGSCHCICSNGFTGSACNVPADSSCTSSDLTSNGTTYHNATMGAALPRLLSAASTNFSLPLSGQILLSLFSTQNLSCNSENALVNFNGKSQRRSLPIKMQPEMILEAAAPLPLLVPTSTLSTPHPTHVLDKRIVSSIIPGSASAAGPTAGAATSNGIIYAVASGATAASSPKATASSSSSSSKSDAKSVVTPLDVDFARTVVLFIFQEKTLSTAVSAQEKLQQALKGEQQGKTGQGYNMSAMDAGQNIIVDFEKFTVDLGNGTLFGGAPSG